ncbi:nucleotidyltransferase domain-containing protein [Virgisporangium aliadipatigenens]|uniref:nucleotidyltransferase domain-containing protein n=1 Tax=Virgisporangium aliadipatigenens TaxID=741659 RepID=UPI001943F6F9|nr:nucleotidyltransferase [Virgisporangium aliadipatigenens]
MTEALQDARRLAPLRYEIFVQGSYANDTNIRGDGDVDLVIQLNLPLEEQLHELTPDEKHEFWKSYESTDYGWEEFREDVLGVLRRRYFVHAGRKCVGIHDLDSLLRLPADVLPAIEYRRYRAFPSLAGEEYDEGVFFRDLGDPQQRAITNFPKLHLTNGRAKNRRTGGRFKEVIRVSKNARLHESAGIAKGVAPSYFVECLLYNVPDKIYRASLSGAYVAAWRWLLEHLPEIRTFRCQNELVDIFGDLPDQWDLPAAETLIRALNTQWQQWRCP